MNSSVIGLKAGVLSMQDVVSKTGRDYEEHLEQLVKEKKLNEDKNIKFAYEPYGDKGAVAPQESEEDEKTKKNNEESS